MKRSYLSPLTEIILFEDNENYIATCSEDCGGCYYAECTPSYCFIASASISSIVPKTEAKSKKQEGPKNPVGFNNTFDH